MDKDQRKKLLLPYLPEIVRLAGEIQDNAGKLKQDIGHYYLLFQ